MRPEPPWRRAARSTTRPATAGIARARTASVTLDDGLDRCCALEARSAALYRSFAAGGRDQPDLCALWTAMAREEDNHVRILDATRRHLPTIEGWVTQLADRWGEVVREVERKLSVAERLPRSANVDKRLAAALQLELTEFEPLRQMVMALSQRRPPRPIAQDHALRLIDAAERLSTDPQVRQLAALLRDRAHPHS